MGFFDNFFGGNKNQQTTKTGPWVPSQQYLKGGMKSAEELLTSGSGFNSYPGQGWVDFSRPSLEGMGGIMDLARSKNPFSGATGFTKGLMGGDYDIGFDGFAKLRDQNAINVNPELRGLLGNMPNAIGQYGTGIASGANGINVGGGLQGLMGQTANALGQNASGMASGADGINTGGQYQSLFNDIDPSRDAIVDKQANRLSDDISRQFGGASFGSAGHTGALTDQVGDFRERMASNMREADFGRQMGALGAMTGVQGQNLQNRLGAASALSGEQSNALGQRAGLLGQMGGFQGQNISNQLNAAGMLSGEQFGGLNAQSGILGQIGQNQLSNFDAKRGVLGDIANLKNTNIQNQMAGVNLAGTANDLRYDPYRRMLDVGGMKEGKEGEILQSQMDKFYRDDMSEWNRLTQAMGMWSGTGQQGSQTQTQVPSSGFGQMLGGGLLGLQALQGMGGFGGGGFGGGSYMY